MEGVFSKFREIADKVTNVVMNYTVVETKVRDATNDEPWGPTGAAMQELAHYTYNYEHYSEVMTTLWKRMLFDNKNQWRRVSKTLTLLGYLVRHGSERVVSSAREHVYDMKLLETYQCTDEHGRDQGIIVRQKVKDLLEFIEDNERVRAERKHAKTVKEKMSGISGDAYSSRRHYSDEYDGEKYRNEDPDWQRGDRRDDVYEEEEDYPRRSQKQTEFKDDDEDDDEIDRRTRTKEATRHSDRRTAKQNTTQNAKELPKFQKRFGDLPAKKNEEDEFDPRAGEKGDGPDDGYGDFLDYRSKSTQGASTAAGDLLDLELMTTAPVVSAAYPSAVPTPAPLSPKISGVTGVQPSMTIGIQPSMTGLQPNLMGIQPGMMTAQPGMMAGQPGIRAGQPGMMAGQPGMMAGQPGMMAGQGNMMGVQPNLMGGQTNMMGGSQPNMMGVQPGMMGGGQPNMMGVQPGMMGVQPGMMGVQPGMMGVQPGMMGVQPGMMGVQPGMMGVRQQSMMGFYQPNMLGNQQPSMGLYSTPGGMHQPIMAGGVSAQGLSGFHQQSDSLL